MSTAMVLFDGNPLNSILSPNSTLLTPIQLILESIIFMDEACSAIRENRNLGPNTSALDSLQRSLERAHRQLFEKINAIQEKYNNNLNNYGGSSVDVLNECNQRLTLELLPRLRRVALGGSNGLLGNRFGTSSMENPHFGEITRRFEEIGRVIGNVIERIEHRMEQDHSFTPRFAGLALPPRPRKKKSVTFADTNDEITVNKKVLEDLIEHARNSWFEMSSGKNLVYVNAYDPQKIRTERPSEDAYIKRDMKAREHEARFKGHKEYMGNTPGPWSWILDHVG